MSTTQVALMIGDREYLNGQVLKELQARLNTERVSVCFLQGKEDKGVEDSLTKYLLGVSSLFSSAQAAFALAAGRKAEEVGAVVIDIKLPLGESFKNGDYTALEETFPNLQYIVLCCSHDRIIEAASFREETVV